MSKFTLEKLIEEAEKERDTFIALFFGILLGLALAFLIWMFFQ